MAEVGAMFFQRCHEWYHPPLSSTGAPASGASSNPTHPGLLDPPDALSCKRQAFAARRGMTGLWVVRKGPTSARWPPLTPALSPFVKNDGEREVTSLSPLFRRERVRVRGGGRHHHSSISRHVHPPLSSPGRCFANGMRFDAAAACRHIFPWSAPVTPMLECPHLARSTEPRACHTRRIRS